jgi:hypothetical protein
MYTRLHGATVQLTVIFIVNASILTPGGSRHTPRDDGTLVQSDIERHGSTANANSAKVGWHLITHTNGTFPQSLTNCQLHVEYGNTFNCQQDKVRYQECTCKKLKTGMLQYFLHSSLHTMNWQFINDSAQRLYVSMKNVSQSYTPNTFRLSHQLMRMQGSVLGYEIKIYCNRDKVECVLQCIFWVFWLEYPPK